MPALDVFEIIKIDLMTLESRNPRERGDISNGVVVADEEPVFLEMGEVLNLLGIW